eukprot:Em0003g1570a
MTKSITAVDEHSSLVNNIISSDFESAERYDFETIEISGYKATEQALQHCQMTVLRPYLGFLKLVFLSCSGASTKNYLKTLIRKLHTRYIHDVERYILVISSLFGFFAFDALYATVVINYVSQSELIIYFLRSIMVKARVKSQQLNELIKDIFHAHGILQVFNGHLSYIVSLSMFICVSDVISSFLNLYTLRDNGTSLGYAVGLCNIIQWFILAISPVIQAARLTKECHKLRQLGLEVSARPFTYKDTPQEALDSFLQYTSSTKYGAKLVGVVIHPKYLAVLLFGLGLFFTLYTFSHTPWL